MKLQSMTAARGHFTVRPYLFASLMAIVLSGCGKAPQAVPTKAPATTAAPSASTAKSDALPAECDAYIRSVTACVDRLGVGNPGATSIRQQMESARAEWAKVADKTVFAASCKQMEDSFKATAAPALKC